MKFAEKRPEVSQERFDGEPGGVMGFGKYKGSPLSNVPASYLLWLSEQSWRYPDFKDYVDSYVEKYREVLLQEKEAERRNYYENNRNVRSSGYHYRTGG